MLILITLFLSTLLAAANISQTPLTDIINVKSTLCGEIRASSISCATFLLQLFLTSRPQKRLLLFLDPMDTSTG